MRCDNCLHPKADHDLGTGHCRYEDIAEDGPWQCSCEEFEEENEKT